MGHLKLSQTLNESQIRHAKKIRIPIEEYQQHIISRLVEMRGNILPKTIREPKMKRKKIVSKNPVLIVGAGQSSQQNFDSIKNFKGIIIALDSNFDMLMANKIIPDYILSLEVKVRPSMFHPENLDKCKDKTKLIGSAMTHNSVTNMAQAHGMKWSRYLNREEPRITNVGLFSIVFAKEELKADKIFLMGFEHNGLEYVRLVFEIWQYDFWYFIKKWPKKLIVNCTDGGALYFEDYILDATLDSLEVIK